MEFKFRAKVKVKKAIGKILRPDGTASQAEFFDGTTGAVIRHDPVKGGYLVVLDCPEIAAAMGETITAYFSEHELEPLDYPLDKSAHEVGLAAGLPFEYPSENTANTGYGAMRAKHNRAKRTGDA
jgi:hypothetical protein